MPPEVVSHYQVLEPVGRGGMGVVHRGWDLKLEREVALKFLSAERLASAEDRERFYREARALSALNHPHVATVYEVDENAGTPFLVMEYLRGGTIRDRLAAARVAQRSIPASQLLEWATGLAEALEHAHAHGIVHRDVKSSNAMFDEAGRVKLADFGLAKSHGASDLTSSRSIPGTLGYLSPEQLGGAPAGPRTDLYALGVVLYEAAAGRLPFDGDSPAAAIERVLHGTPAPLRGARPDLPRAFDQVVMRLLAKSPDERHADASALLRELRAIGSSATHSADGSTHTHPVFVTPGTRDRSRFLAVGGVAIALMLAGVAVVLLRPPALPEKKQVVVLPIRCIGGAAAPQSLCDGLTETLTTALSQVGAFAVIPASETRKLESADQARREFGVNLVVYASLVAEEGEAKLSISLIDPERKRTIDTGTVRGALGSLYALENEALAKLADLVGAAGPAAEATILAESSARVPGAFEAYLQGRGFLLRFDKEGNRDRALEKFEEAVRLDPSSALAFAGIAEVHLQVYRSRHEPEELEAARTSAQRALALSPRLAPAQVTLGAVLAEAGSTDEALARLEEALRSDPRNAAAYRELASVYRSQKRLEEAASVYERAIRARPGDWMTHADLARFLYGQQRFPEAAAEYRKVIDLSPDNHLGYRNLGGVLHDMGDDAQAEVLLRKAQALHPTARGLSNLGTVYMTQERYGEAVEVLERAATLATTEAPTEYLIWGNLGDAHWLAEGNVDKAKAAWSRAAEVAERRLERRPGDADLEAVLAEYYAKLGDRDRAMARITDALAHGPASAFVHYQAGVVRALFEDGAGAVAELRDALGLGDVTAQIQQAPELRRLRELQVFQELGIPARTTP